MLSSDLQTKERKVAPMEYKGGGRTLTIDGRPVTDSTPARLTEEEKRAAEAWLKTHGYGIDIGKLLPQNVRAIVDLQRTPAAYQPSKQYTTGTTGRKYSQAEIERAMAEFRRRYPPMMAVRECLPYPGQREEALVAWEVAVKRLRLEYAGLDLRWFDHIKSDVVGDPGPGWKAFRDVTPNLAGVYDHETGTVWLSVKLAPGRVAQLLAHELRHAWQHRTHGSDYFKGLAPDHYHDHESERDARAWANKFISDDTWTWRGW